MNDPYLTEMNRFRLLTREEELELAVRYREHGDRAAGHKLITSNLRFVVKVALGYRSYGVALSDLIQEGNIGLMMALKKFDPYRGYRFISYAVWWIRAYMENFIIRNWSLVKIGTTQSARKLFYKMGKVREALESNREKAEKYQIVAANLGVAEEDITEMQQRMSSRDLSLDVTFDENNELTHLDLLQQDGINQEELIAQKEERKIQEQRVRNAMKHLSEKEVYVVQNRVMADEPLTLQEIGNHLKLSRERVRQIEGQALMKLKRQMSALGANPRPQPSLSFYAKRALKNPHIYTKELHLQQGVSSYV
jgi:RNA polymerase sigma-32 factor